MRPGPPPQATPHLNHANYPTHSLTHSLTPQSSPPPRFTILRRRDTMGRRRPLTSGAKFSLERGVAAAAGDLGRHDTRHLLILCVQ
ncbi:hypothetical protein Pmani_034795 [Petrolisthes manimaculis]|uniref:Uncharacterized protein n=1 Tax=Petrolisthes manimaculis TaxID=1843537 RepID=A0AAE1NNN7_9EUCA|nr:hypothetical protein Pmani_034795 [Petrolisthes manimaculis]